MNYKSEKMRLSFGSDILFQHASAAGVARRRARTAPLNRPRILRSTMARSTLAPTATYILRAMSIPSSSTRSSGETYHLALGINGAAPVNICMALYDPNFKNVFSRMHQHQIIRTTQILRRVGQDARHNRHIYNRCNREFKWHDKLRLGAGTFVPIFPQRATN